jgi:NAD(P)-dependent dehydrogenase (short-subunit alcohol dehydrogenase family)
MQDLNGRRVVITGGSQGLGLAMVEALAACGANVTAIGRESLARRCWAKPREGEHVRLRHTINKGEPHWLGW